MWKMDQRSKKNYEGARGKIKNEQGAKIYEKGAMKFAKKDQEAKGSR